MVRCHERGTALFSVGTGSTPTPLLATKGRVSSCHHTEKREVRLRKTNREEAIMTVSGSDDLLPQRMHVRSLHEFHKLCPHANSLDAFFEVQ
jgi:hypothetical protein